MEEEFFKWLSEQNSKDIGIFAGILGGIYYAYKKISFFQKILSAIWTEKTYETYNENLYLIYEKRAIYKFFNSTLKRDSYDIFKTMKIIYDLTTLENIHSKTITFRFEELLDNSILYSNITRFLDYYKSRNGIKINIFVHSTSADATGNNIKSSLNKYVLDSNIHSVKIISGNYTE